MVDKKKNSGYCKKIFLFTNLGKILVSKIIFIILSNLKINFPRLKLFQKLVFLQKLFQLFDNLKS